MFLLISAFSIKVLYYYFYRSWKVLMYFSLILYIFISIFSCFIDLVSWVILPFQNFTAIWVYRMFMSYTYALCKCFVISQNARSLIPLPRKLRWPFLSMGNSVFHFTFSFSRLNKHFSLYAGIETLRLHKVISRLYYLGSVGACMLSFIIYSTYLNSAVPTSDAICCLINSS